MNTYYQGLGLHEGPPSPPEQAFPPPQLTQAPPEQQEPDPRHMDILSLAKQDPEQVEVAVPSVDEQVAGTGSLGLVINNSFIPLFDKSVRSRIVVSFLYIKDNSVSF